MQPTQGGAMKSSGSSFGQHLVDQRPRWENQVLSRKSNIIRADKRKKKRKYL
jgi:hypothetical protein